MDTMTEFKFNEQQAWNSMVKPIDVFGRIKRRANTRQAQCNCESQSQGCPAGPPGPPGQPGAQGEQGHVEVSGQPGAPRPQGPAGGPGQPVQSGGSGASGAPGQPGQAGAQGTPGAPGNSGSPGGDAAHCPCPSRSVVVRKHRKVFRKRVDKVSA
ncbi:Collagen triple helix repeat protein [Caenorhabditis elegans]|uniref:Collagen triple helix repeat protein n=1 Tax=Caenorhabditis elegans TaxID=6239 RepID=O01860_CAEEL|nr:Collagen triple helix repeat protein [Caenorhabditis elegans]CCD73361.2 Collagen triple helix repeat protein [Caenorhabditis elegans]|eukprot:NP_491786.2 COLlagen [Caenorhabditis elegans]